MATIQTKRLASSKRFLLRLSIPAVLGAGAIGTAFVYPGVASGSTPTLASSTPSAVLAMALAPTQKVYSASVNETGNLGLPTTFLNSLGTSGSGGLSGLLTQALGGTVTANFWTNHAGSARVQFPSSTGEIDLYASPGSLWEWDYSTNTATSITLPSSTTSSSTTSSTTASSLTPAQLADAIISKLPQGSTLSLGTAQYVAGEPAYTLVVNANDPNSLIASVSIAVDANSGNVLGVWVNAVGSTSAAFSSVDTTVSFVAPSSSVLSFTVPSGATVNTMTLPTGSSSTTSSGTTYTHTSYGSGFSTVEEITSSSGSLPTSNNTLLTSLLASGTPVTTAAGSGTLISTSVGSAFIGNNGVIAFGAVPSKVLLGDLG